MEHYVPIHYEGQENSAPTAWELDQLAGWTGQRHAALAAIWTGCCKEHLIHLVREARPCGQRRMCVGHPWGYGPSPSTGSVRLFVAHDLRPDRVLSGTRIATSLATLHGQAERDCGEEHNAEEHGFPRPPVTTQWLLGNPYRRNLSAGPVQTCRSTSGTSRRHPTRASLARAWPSPILAKLPWARIWTHGRGRRAAERDHHFLSASPRTSSTSQERSLRRGACWEWSAARMNRCWNNPLCPLRRSQRIAGPEEAHRSLAAGWNSGCPSKERKKTAQKRSCC